ncbi:MAG: response regulator transcription factor [Gemmatimonadota bacterium]|nr:response regulator transcription factor [Gemmatimonadota bacterium]MDH3366400.1 response regulator transcription factor [Gemmatimonadota bacterium]MDH3477586.1 response regulator transcription factor [Gemmatimonadota bacterium]MDH3568605.1 response regulator transcription factor [Gemmatimonadota bacterium]MDH5548677.1 response regulator transcription factor [Gemmatimonadota bacterium]
MATAIGGRVLSVLIVDDSDVIRQRLVAMLAEVEAVNVVGEASDGETGLVVAQETKPDVVILDIRMPGLSGITVLQRLQEFDSPPKVMVLTNFPYAAYRTRCRALGAAYFFDKSTEFEAALAALLVMAAESR